MTRQEHLTFCKQCKNRKFDSNKGIICGLTSEIAAFETVCENYDHDSEVKTETIDDNEEVGIPVGVLPEIVLSKLKSHQDLSYAIIGGLLAAVVSAVIWAIITVTFKYQIAYMAIGVGFLVGFTVRFFGAGVENIYGYIGAFFSLLGCLLGNLLSQVGFYAESDSLGYFQVISLLNLEIILSIFEETFSPLDLLFYGFAIFQGYKMSFRPIEVSFLNADVSESVLKPSHTNLRLPMAFICLLFFSVVLYQVKQGGNGHRTFYYESGNKMSEGEFYNNREHGKWTYYNEDGALNFAGYYKEGFSDSTWQWYDGNNNVIRNGFYKAGLPHGAWINFYPSGLVSDSGAYSSGRKNGLWVAYFENGKMSQKGSYRRYEMEGPWISYFDNGTIESEGNYVNNSPHGLWKYYLSSGEVIEEIEYTGSDESRIINVWSNKNQVVKEGNGEYISLYENGKVMLKGNVVDGKKSGLWTIFYENGEKKEEGFYEGNLYKILNRWDSEGNQNIFDGNGIYTSMLLDGAVIEKGEIKNGLRTGGWEMFYPQSGNLLQQMNYENGMLEGEVMYYFENGMMYIEGFMKGNERDGLWNWYYEDGGVESSVSFKNGKKEGIQTFYSESGNKLKEEEYSNGAFLGEVLVLK